MRRSLFAGILLAGAVALTACKIDDSGSGQKPQGQGGNPQGDALLGTPGPEQFQNGQNGGPAGPALDPTAAAALQDMNRLAVGMLYLQDANTHPLSKDQAAKLLPFWQDIQTAMRPPEGGVVFNDANGTPLPPQQQGEGPGPDETPGTFIIQGPDGSDQNGGFSGGRPQRFMFALDPVKVAADVAGIRAALTQEQISEINALTQDDMTATLQKHSITMGFAFGRPGGRNGGPGGNGNFQGGFQGDFSGTPGAFATARAEGTFPARPTLSPDELATAQARREQGDPLIFAVVTMLQALAGG